MTSSADSIALPDLPCPFARYTPALPAYFAESEKDFLAMLDPRLRDDPMLDDARPAMLARSGFPDVGRTGLTIAMAWFSWFFFHDDWCATRSEPEILALNAEAVGVLRGERAPRNPILLLLERIRQEITAHSPEWDVTRLCRLTEQWLAASVWELHNSRRGHVPSLAAYRALRVHDAAALAFFELLMLLDGIALPEDVRDHPVVDQMFVMAGNYCSWANDLVSLPKELREGTTGNLVIVLRHELDCSVQQAVDEVCRMCLREAEAFVELKNSLPELGITVDDALRHQLLRLEQWQALSSVWQRYDLPRYGTGS